MYRTLFARLLLAALLVLSACGGSETDNNAADTGVQDAATDVAPDAGDPSDAADTVSADTVSDTMLDTARDTADTVSDTVSDAEQDTDPDTEEDAGEQVPRDGFGAISGSCGVLDDELTSGESFFIENTIDFGTDPYDDADESLLTDGGREIIADGNAGGSSILSEVFAYEVLERCELATLFKTENEVSYTVSDTSITDLLVEIDGLKVGVSVTRAVGWPREDPYTVEQATTLLTDKLQDVQESSANVAAEDAWTKQILHVIAYEPQHADSLETAYGQLDASVVADTVVFVTVSSGDDAFLY
ncbi:hypothetical protein FIV42_17605 [Persicimonas caeni]|uniref:Uncharacterized protein n=1 Tax=Persicimonas caeni TaxID=2292766 RepID=A0A4Y6PWT6_PERCE|nr:hypothetical protein [Persicimonas caeni]QDG52487.1 hypothetical protein FIV42_17605 [Persicimonas caeni]QED33709.1 hypothetical protein FRD00_17600 [Persicimonas caeni]